MGPVVFCILVLPKVVPSELLKAVCGFGSLLCAVLLLILKTSKIFASDLSFPTYSIMTSSKGANSIWFLVESNS